MAMLEIQDIRVNYGMINAIKAFRSRSNKAKLLRLSVLTALVKPLLCTQSAVCSDQSRDKFCSTVWI